MEHGIMSIYLQEQSGEVLQMISMEWDDDIYRAVLLEEGAEIGEARALHETARKMKAKGLALDVIKDVTGLSSEEILAL